MVTDFTVADWKTTVNTPEGDRISVQFSFPEKVPSDISIQLFEKYGEGEYQLIMFRLNLMISIMGNVIIVTNNEPFDGKIVIK